MLGFTLQAHIKSPNTLALHRNKFISSRQLRAPSRVAFPHARPLLLHLFMNPSALNSRAPKNHTRSQRNFWASFSMKLKEISLMKKDCTIRDRQIDRQEWLALPFASHPIRLCCQCSFQSATKVQPKCKTKWNQPRMMTLPFRQNSKGKGTEA
jgi:hypothetical protein